MMNLTIRIQRIKCLIKIQALVLCLGLGSSLTGLAATITVASLPELQTAIDRAVAGDVILLKDGVYTSTGNILVKCSGTAAQPITIAAQHIAGAEIGGTGGISLQKSAAYVTIRGFKFTNAANKNELAAGSSFCRVTRNVFECTGDGNYLSIIGNDHQVDYNTFQHKNAMGKFIGVRGTGKQIAERLWIHHNYFYDFKAQTGNGAEGVQFGLSGFSLSSTHSIFEYNLFEKCDGEAELLSVKASALTVRYNTVRDCKAHITLRHGNFNQVYGNYFLLTPGLRIFGDDHLIYSNYFENCNPAINIGNGGAEVADGAPLTSHDRPDRVLIAFNILVDNKSNIVLKARTPVALGATAITILNNLIVGGGAAAAIEGPLLNSKWEGNVIFKVKDVGYLSAGTYKVTDPGLLRDASGTYHLGAAQAGLNVAGAYPSITVDMDGQPRIQPLQAGADQLSAAPKIATILTPELVGYKAK